MLKANIKSFILKKMSSIRESVIGEKAEIGAFSRFHSSQIGNYSYVSDHCNIYHAKIGNFCSISSGVYIGGGSHPIQWGSTSPVFQKDDYWRGHLISHNEYDAFKETVIENDVWIGVNAIILGGVRVKTGAVIGAGSVVTKDVGPYEVWCGNPARMIKKRFDDETINRLLKTNWWNFNNDELCRIGSHVNDVEDFVIECEAVLKKGRKI